MVATGIDDEVPVRRLSSGAAQRTIERVMPRSLHCFVQGNLVLDREGAELCDNAPFHLRRGNLGGNLLKGGRAWKTQKQHRGRTGDAPGIRGDFDAISCELSAAAGVDVRADDMPSALPQIARDRASHD